MNPVEERLLQALSELDEAVKSMAAANPKPNLLPLFQRIDELAGQLPAETEHGLSHYLRKKSYEKALLHLQTRAKGECRQDASAPR